MGVSVVVVSYEPEPWLGRCLASVAGTADEIVVVDNASSDGRASEIARSAGATAIRMQENLGFAGGVNAGVASSKGDHVALLNDDAFADRSWLPASVDVLADPAVAAVSPKLLLAWKYATVRVVDEPHFVPGDGRALGRQVKSITVGGADAWRYVRATGLYPDEGGWRWSDGNAVIHVPLLDGRDGDEVRVNGEVAAVEGVHDLVNNAGSYLTLDGSGGDIGYEAVDEGQFDEGADRFAACGAAMVFRRETFERLGPLAGDFFAYYEDTDWSWRAQLAGMRIRYEPAATVRHVHAATSGEWSPRFTFLVARNRLLCLARNAPLDVARAQLRAARPLPKGVPSSLARRLPGALRARRRHARQWTRSPYDVWSQWAGVNAPAHA